MRLLDPGPVPPFDASAFATYDNEQDAAPLASELVEDLPDMPTAVGEDEVSAESKPVERPPFRGKGYLRAEAPPETDDTDFGGPPDQAGPGRSQSPHPSDSQSAQLPVGQKPGEKDATGAESRSSPTGATDLSIRTGTAAPGKGDVGDTDETSRRKRRRKPRRRRRGNGENKGETGTPATPQTSASGDQATAEPAAASINSDDQPVQSATDSTTDTPTGTADDKTNSDKPTPRRRRRRSRNRGRGKSDGTS
ncbi:MAG: hypothetical protein ABGZ23_23270 [Fuerstiella sp.]